MLNQPPYISYPWPGTNAKLTLAGDSFTFHLQGKTESFSLLALNELTVTTKRKLAPLVGGAILTSLAMVNILLKGASLNMLAFLSVGLLILYAGFTSYWVLTLQLNTETKAYWLNKNKYINFPSTMVKIINFKISKGYYPPVYVALQPTNKQEVDKLPLINSTTENPIPLYLLPPKGHTAQQLTSLSLENIVYPITAVTGQEYWGLLHK